MREFRLPLSLATIGHAGLIAALIWLVPTPSVPVPPLQPENAIEVAFAPPVPVAPPPPEPVVAPPEPEPTPPPPEPEPPHPVAEIPPPEPPPIVEPEPPPPGQTAIVEVPLPPPPPEKPVPPKPPPKPRPQPARIPPPESAPAFVARAAPPQTAAIPTPPLPAQRAPIISATYRSMLSAWLEAHKRYPDGARQRGEEGRAVLRFRVARNGRVLDFAVVQSAGYPELDASLNRMMNGATMPAFTPDMTAAEIDVTLTIRFGLTR